jgi:hypothetical protein
MRGLIKMGKVDQYKLTGGTTKERRIRTKSFKKLYPDDARKMFRARDSFRPEKRLYEFKTVEQ